MQARDIHSSGYEFEVIETSKNVFMATVISKSFELAVSMGSVPGHSIIDKFGANPLITTTSDPEDVIEQGGIQKLADFGTAPILYVSSEETSDNQLISITGLDIAGLPVTQDAQLDGFNNVVLSTPLFRVFTMETNDSTSFVGPVYCHDDPTPTDGLPDPSNIYTMMTVSNQRTLLCSYTIPVGKVGFLYRGELGIEVEGNAGALSDFSRFLYLSRRLGKVFTSKKRVTVMASQGVYQDERVFPDIIPALTDVKVQVQEVSATMGSWATLIILLVDQELLPPALISALGQ